jgi:DNA polymerase (family 10)
MNQAGVAAVLEEIGLLLELLGENPFKTRAYRNAARIVRGLDRDLAELVRRKELTDIKGIGAALAEKIGILTQDGDLPYVEELRGRVPPGLLEWLQIPGLGANKARAIHVALDISTLGELEYACRENRLRDLPGFGERSQRKILAGIELLRRNAGRYRQDLLQREARELLRAVANAPGVARAEICGSLRRWEETSRGIVIVAAAGDAGPVLDRFSATAGINEILERGPDRCRVRLVSGPPADLHVVPDSSFACALVHFTGSEAHVAALRSRAAGLGLELRTDRLADQRSGRTVECADEDGLYRALGLAWIPAELREERGEIEAAENGSLPRLIEQGDLRGLLHCHSTWSDGTATIEEMAEATRALGLDYLGLCDHSQAAAYAGGLDREHVVRQHEEIDAINRRCDGAFRVLKGIEVDILADGALDFPDEVLATFDLVVASVHSRFQLGEDEQTRRILRAMENPYVDVLGHVTGRLLLAREGYALDLERILRSAADRGIALEVNAHPHRLDLDWPNLRRGLELGMKTCINPDAHSVEGLGDVVHGLGVARKGWCTAEDALNAFPLQRLQDYLRARRRGAGGRT